MPPNGCLGVVIRVCRRNEQLQLIADRGRIPPSLPGSQRGQVGGRRECSCDARGGDQHVESVTNGRCEIVQKLDLEDASQNGRASEVDLIVL